MKNLFKTIWKFLDGIVGVDISLEKANTKKWMVTVKYKLLGMTVLTETMPLTEFIK